MPFGRGPPAVGPQPINDDTTIHSGTSRCGLKIYIICWKTIIRCSEAQESLEPSLAITSLPPPPESSWSPAAGSWGPAVGSWIPAAGSYGPAAGT